MKRLKKRSQFDQAMGGEVLARSKNFVLHRAESIAVSNRGSEINGGTVVNRDATEPSSVGTITPKRWAKSAVRRNTIRRIFFDQVNQHLVGVKHKELTGLYVLRLNRKFDVKVFRSANSDAFKSEVRTQIVQLLIASSQSSLCKAS